MYYLLAKLGMVAIAAETIRVPNPLSGCAGANANLGCVAEKILAGVYAVSLVAVPLMILWGGFQILTSAGDPEKLKNGKQTILYAVLGFLIVLAANGAVSLLSELLGGS